MAYVSLKVKMTLAASLLMGVVVALLGWGGFWFFSRQIKQSVAEQQYTLVLATASQLDRQLHTTRQLVEAEADSLFSGHGTATLSLQEEVALHRELRRFFDAGLLLLAPDGRLLSSSLPGDAQGGPVWSPGFPGTPAKGGPKPTTKPLFCTIGGEPAVFFPVPVPATDGVVRAYLAGGLFLSHDNFLGRLSNSILDRDGYLYLFDRQRRLIVYPDRQRLLQPLESDGSNPLLNRVLSGFDGSGEMRIDGNDPALGSFKHLAAEDWILGAAYPLTEAYAPIRQAQRLFLPAFAALLLLCSAMVWWIMRRLTAPLETLTAYVSGPANETWAIPPQLLRQQDEIGLFAAAFQQLLERMRGHETALGEQLHFLQILIDTLPNPVFYKDIQGKYLGCNRAFESFLGRPREELVGQSVYDLSPPDLAEVYHQADLDLFASGETQVYDATVQYADGSRHQVIFFKAPFANSDGSLGGLIGTFLDISERKRVEAALQEQKTFSDNLLRYSGAPTFVLNADHQILTWNRAMEILSGKAAPLMLGTRNQWQAFYTSPRPCLADLVLNEEPDLDPAHWGYRLLRPSELAEDGLQAEGWFSNLNGPDRYLFFNATPIRDSQGEVVAVIETIEDITDRQKRQQEMEVIAQVTTALRTAGNRTEIQSVTLDYAHRLTQARAVSLLFLTRPGEGPVMEQARGLWAKAAGLQLGPEQDLARLALESRSPQVHKLTPQASGVAGHDLMQDLAYLVCIPLIEQEQSVGALCAGFDGPVRDQVVRQLIVIGDIAASSLRRALLHEQTERQLQRLVALHNIDLAITSNFDLRQILKVLLEQVCGQLQVDAGDVFLYRPDQGQMEFAAGRGFIAPRELPRNVPLAGSWLGRVVNEQLPIPIPQPFSTGDPRGRALTGREGFVFGVALPLVSQGQVQGVLEIFHRAPLEPPPEWFEFLDALGTQAAIAIVKATLLDNLQRSNSRLRLAYDTTIEGWSRALDLRDKETEGHSTRVSAMALRLARAMGYDEEQLLHIRRGALLHDIGKMGIPDRILLKTGPLNESEWELMRQHPRFGYELLSPIEHLRPALDIPYCHHEKWDGSGYPRGLKGEQIPLAARIFSVVDTWDALRSDRPYRAGWSAEKVADYLQRKAGSDLDPAVVAAFLALDPEAAEEP
jgi:PAS domain S-box-containing protein/putative nucleotidyltransferase with HDIG domain